MYTYQLNKQIFIRFVAFSSRKVEGVFRFEDKLQISPVPDECPKIKQILGSHPFIVEYQFPKPDLDHVNKISGNGQPEGSDKISEQIVLLDLTDVIRDEIVALLALFFDPWIAVQTSSAKHWVLDLECDPKSVFSQEGYICDLSKDGGGFRSVEAQDMLLEERNRHFNSFAHGMSGQKIPDNMSDLLTAYFSLGGDAREGFQKSLALFHQSMQCQRISTSLSYIGLVSAIEKLIAIEHQGQETERCSDCGQPKYKVSKKFIEFLTKYSSKAPGYSKIAGRMYQTRSGIGHAGTILADDVVGKLTSGEEDIEAFYSKIGIQVATRISLVNWLMARLRNST